YYSFGIGAADKTWPVLKTFWTEDILPCMPVASLFLVYFFYSSWKKEARSLFYFDCAAAAGMIVMAWYSRLINGGFLNAVIPAYTVLCAYSALGLYRACRESSRKLLAPALFLIFAAQFGMLFYTPSSVLPTAEDLRAGEKFLEKLKSFPGNVLIPY